MFHFRNLFGRSSNSRGTRPGSNHDRFLWSVVVGLLVLALGLIPLYVLASGRRAEQTAVSSSTAVPGGNAPSKNLGPTVVAQSVAGPTSAAAQTPVPLPTVSMGDSRFAILLLGYGGGDHPGGYLTDSIMVVIVDPAQKTLTLLSIPRDSWVPLMFDGKDAVYNKVNTAYAFAKDPSLYPDRLSKYTGDHGAGTFSEDTISRLIGVPIKYYITLDFVGFRQMIDAVGGIDVNVPVGFTARYPENDDPTINANWIIIHFTAGEQHMNGERAIEYARAREVIDNSNQGSDFARSQRQRLIIEAFKNRLLQPGGLVHIPQLLKIGSSHVDTNYEIPAVTQLSQLILGWKDVKFYQTALTTDNYLEEGTGRDNEYLLVPDNPDHSWANIRAFVRRLWDNPAAGVAMASTTVTVQNDSGVPGLATQVSEALTAMGYQVNPPVDGPLLSQSQILDSTNGAATPLIKQLQKDLGLKDLSVAKPIAKQDGITGFAAPTANDGGIVLELGSDEANLSVSVPEDLHAPESNVGVLKAGIWLPGGLPSLQPTPVPYPSGRSSGQSGASPESGGPSESPVPTPSVLPSGGATSSTATPPPVEAGLPTATRVPRHVTPIPVQGNPGVVVVPNLTGLSEAAAQRIINESGLMTTYVNYQTIDQVANKKFFRSIAPGHVLSQSPSPGTKVPRGTRVALAVREK